MFPTRFGVNWLLGLGVEVKDKFSRWLPSFLASLVSIGLSVQEKKQKIDFQDGGHLGFPIEMIFTFFDL